MLKDLEPLLEQVYAEGNYDAEGAIMRFGHGDCHDLTWALHEKFGAKIVAIVGQDSGMPVHSCVLLNESTTLDAYGINALEKTVERYSKIAMEAIQEPVIAKNVDSDWISAFGGNLYEEPEDVLVEFEPVMQLLDITLENCFDQSRI
ncbi:hypothetical protein A1QO_02545 [Vibrio genomosp. F10 str. ZF-129]|uniref:Uncharacterized protein n=1 Tax=Vibrio genomosp. F10 str. ZF-129 TaxID=1187848 RepID=A0A1E5BKB9_9VIBR|nr:hypothetical protein [Vibrio genomosp. F10]OEE38276.1 hypothetical protein A1QO_02545 [Vibrio genomosp. F10 str. ZF-129]